VLSQQRADRDEPVVVLLHLACPRVEYTDRGKSAVVVTR
jgi:DNA topoisomerase VI subunit B